MKEHAGRVVSALVALPLLYAAIMWLPAALFGALIAFVAALAQTELYGMALPTRATRVWAAGRLPVFAAGVLGGAALVLVVSVAPGWDPRVPAMMTAVVLGIVVTALTVGRDLRVAGADAAVAVFGVWYVAWLLGHVALLRQLPQGAWLVVFVLWVTWAADAAAYYGGKSLGRTALAPTISPKKTMEGAVAALAGGAIASAAAAVWFLDGLAWPEAAVFGAVIAAVGIVGDLFESLLKRGAGVKDSGGLIPSHGGVLDKIDGLLFTAPLVYYYMAWVKGSGAAGTAP